MESERKLKEVILHFRRHSGGVLKNNEGKTILIIKEGAIFKVAEARCGKKDNFNRAVGIAIVRGRMVCDRKVVNTLMAGDTLVNYLTTMNKRYNEKYDTDFFKRLLAKLA